MAPKNPFKTPKGSATGNTGWTKKPGSSTIKTVPGPKMPKGGGLPKRTR